MNFFEAQDRARKRTGLLVVLFAVAVVSMIALAYLAAYAVLAAQEDALGEPFKVDYGLLQPVVIGMLAVISVGTLYKLATIGNGSAVASAMGGTLLTPATAKGDQRQLLNIVEEMAVASGAPMPQVYVMPDSSVNAFAAGTRPANAVIGVTQGAIEHFTREQMQGVVAHEFSHILNGDMRLNLRLVGIIHGLMLVGYMGYFLLPRYTMFRRSRSSGPQIAIGLSLIVIGFIGTFSGSLIKAAVSRQREFLADASAVQFTRNPEGIAGALQSIGKHTGRIKNEHAAEFSHMFFANAITSMMTSPFATHPPLAKRIKRVLPNWDGVEPIGRRKRPAEPGAKAAPKAKGGMEQLAQQAGMISAAALYFAAQERKRLPKIVHKAVEDPYSARALIYALLLERKHDGYLNKQLNHLQEHADAGVFDLVEKLFAATADIPRRARMQLALVAMPTLRMLTPKQCDLFLANIRRVIELDGSLDLFEWCMEALIAHNLLASQDDRKKPGKATEDDLSYTLSMLARVGNPADEAPKAFARSCEGMPVKLQYQDSNFDADRMFAAVQRIAELAPRRKEAFVNAALACVMHDGKVTSDEEALLRTFLAVLDCPMPATAA